MLDDEEVSTGWLTAYAAAMQKYESDVYTGPVKYLFPLEHVEWVENKGKSVLLDGASLRRASTNNVTFSLLLEEPRLMRFDKNMALCGRSDSDFFMRFVARGGKIIVVLDAVVTEKVLANRLTIRWRLARQYRSGINRVYISFKLSSLQKVVWSSMKMVIKRLMLFILRLITSPLILIFWLLKTQTGVLPRPASFSQSLGHSRVPVLKTSGTVSRDRRALICCGL